MTVFDGKVCSEASSQPKLRQPPLRATWFRSILYTQSKDGRVAKLLSAVTSLGIFQFRPQLTEEGEVRNEP